MNSTDAFAPIASYYDAIMSHVDYDRWAIVAGQLQTILPDEVHHLDVACGTGTFVLRMRRHGWNSWGADLSKAMIDSTVDETFAVADMTALPYPNDQFDCVSCLFDSINFLLTPEKVSSAIAEFHRVLRPGGVLYFDAVTERMVLDHFAGQEWTESNEGFDTTWSSKYSRTTCLSETTVQVAGHKPCLIREQIYSIDLFRDLLAQAGFTLLDVFDAETWRKPTRRTIRLEFVSVRSPRRGQRSDFAKAAKQMRRLLTQR